MKEKDKNSEKKKDPDVLLEIDQSVISIIVVVIYLVLLFGVGVYLAAEDCFALAGCWILLMLYLGGKLGR